MINLSRSTCWSLSRSLSLDLKLLNGKMPKKAKSSKQSKETGAVEVANDSGKAISVNKVGQIVLRVRAKPGAKQTLITDVSDEDIGIAIAAPPKDGQANEELVDFLTKLLNLKKAEIVLDKGATSKSKVLLITAKRNVQEIHDKFVKEIE